MCLSCVCVCVSVCVVLVAVAAVLVAVVLVAVVQALPDNASRLVARGVAEPCLAGQQATFLS